METFQASIPVKQRMDVVDALADDGVNADIVDSGEGSHRCVIRVTGSTKDARTTVRSVLGSHNLSLLDDDE